MKNGFDTFMENPYWKKYYENAPSDALKEYIRFEFENNPYVSEKRADNYEEEKAKITARFTGEDRQYLIDNTTNGQAKTEYRKSKIKLQNNITNRLLKLKEDYELPKNHNDFEEG